MNDRALPRPRAAAIGALALASVPFLLTAFARAVATMRLEHGGVAAGFALVWVAVVVGAMVQRRPALRAAGAGLALGTAATLATLVWLTLRAASL